MSISAFVTDGVNTWLETIQFHFYDLPEAKEEFKRYLDMNNLTEV